LMEEIQFDTIYHEHFSYFSLAALEEAFKKHGLALFDVEELTTHGGSLRIFMQHEGAKSYPPSENLMRVRDREAAAGLNRLEGYETFPEKVRAKKREILAALIDIKQSGKSIVVYGAAAKGNTLLNYCGTGKDFIDYAVDRNPAKQGCFLPGTHIPVFSPERIKETKPDYLFILPWNIQDEIMNQMNLIREWGGRFIVPLPELKILQ